jgi:hypothetical protein
MNALFVILVFGLVVTTLLQVSAEYRPIRFRSPRSCRAQILPDAEACAASVRSAAPHTGRLFQKEHRTCVC